MISLQTGDVPVIQMPENVSTTDFWASFKGLSFDEFVAKIANGLVSFGFKLALAILVFYVGRFIIRKVYKGVFNIMTGRHVDASLTTFVLSLVKMTLYFILIITIIGILGLETSSFLAIFASAGVAMGMALSGTLQNFAGGVLILLLKPYKVGDYIEVQGYSGTVKSIQLFSTVINTIDNKAIIIPNGALSTSSINNYSLEQYRRVDWKISLAYGTDVEKAREAINKILISDIRVVRRYVEDDMAYREEEAHKKELAAHHGEEDEHPVEPHRSIWSRLFRRDKGRQSAVIATGTPDDLVVSVPQKRVDRKPFIGLNEMGDSAIVLVVRAWTHSSNYWGVYFDINERLYKELPEQGFSFPFPQMDVHLDQIQN